MKYCNLRGIKSSRIVMGCMRIADKPLQQTESLIVEAVKSGVNTFDLADIYGKGDCERILGVAVKDLGLARKDYVIQTKCGIRKGETGTWYDFSKEHIISSVEGSLKRLNTSYVDSLLLHRPDTLIEPEEVAEAVEKLLSQGKIRSVGVSNFSALQIKLLENYGVNVATNQMQFSLAHTPMVDAGMNVNMYVDEATSRAGDTLEYCRTRGISLQAWSPLGYGFLEGIFIGNEKFPRLNATLEVMAAEKDCTPAALAIAWVLRHPAFGQAVTGTTNPERMKELCKAADVTLTREEWYRLYLANERVLP
jgi:predicted oxidoreductase